MIARLPDGNRQLSAKGTEVKFISYWPSRKINIGCPDTHAAQCMA